ncbi:MAG TPA: transcription termination factor Rho [Phycisphaerae bacterium]|nr:transcription termination factor Rho [Phycisphaerae bacterium]
MSQTNGNEAAGTLEVMDNGIGYLRDPSKNYAPIGASPQVTRDAIKALRLRGGEYIEGVRGRSRNGGKPILQKVERICGREARQYGAVRPFDELEVVHPVDQLKFETNGGPMSMRVVDLFAPIGKGQRALIVAPPRTGKTILLQHMAAGIQANHPEVLLMMLLVDERPEEVTEMRREVCKDGAGWHNDAPEVLFSSNDHDAKSHGRITKLAIEKAKRAVEMGRDVVILMDSLTRLGRAYNTLVGNSGRTMTGGLDIRALEIPKQTFGAARKIENGGSLTIIASVLIETGSRMDEFIFQEFKGTGNMELVLSRDLANLRIYPACNLSASGTRKEEMLLGQVNYDKVTRVRRRLLNMPPARQMETMLDELAKFPNNETFLKHLA